MSCPQERSEPSGESEFLTSSAGSDSPGEPDEGENARLRDAFKAYHLDMRRLHPESSDSESADLLLPADIRVREEPEDEEEEDEEEQGGGEDEDGDEGYDGYSE